jgi:hypothetical protein
MINPIKKHESDNTNGERRVKTRLLGSLPAVPMDNGESDKRIKRINRYLQFQGNRILKCIEEKKLQKACLIWCILAKNSLSYQMALYSKVNKK